MSNHIGPPYDGKPCPMCPAEVRNLMAVVHNYVNRMRRGSMSSDTTLDDLDRALKACEPLRDAHFSDPMHSHGSIR
jgi:hypothetical protein